MNPSKSILWGPEKQALLKSLRLSAGIDLATLARHNIVSTTQVRQLEDGGDSSFYSPEIKFSLGKKLLKYLGHDLTPEVALEPPLSISPDRAQAETASSGHAAETLISQSEESLPSHPAKKPPSIIFPLFITGAVALVALWLWMGSEDHLANEVVKPSSTELKASSQVDLIADATVEKPAPFPNAENKTDSLPTKSTQKDASKPDHLSACRWSKEEEEIQPESPRKGGDYVHVVAQQAITVCIMDGQERAAILNLQDGEGRSIYGPPPFRVYSSDFQGLKVYFQGQQIKLAKQDTQQIKLTAATYMPLKN